MSEEKWKWLSYLLSNGLITQHIENCAEITNSKYLPWTNYVWSSSKEGYEFWSNHWDKAIDG